MKISINLIRLLSFIFLISIISSCANGSTQNKQNPTQIVVGLNSDNGGVTNGESNVSLYPMIVLSFSAPMNPATINAQTVFLSTSESLNSQKNISAGNIIPITLITASNNNTTFTFSSQAMLAQNTKYYITTTNSITSSTGVTAPYTQFYFTTGIFSNPTVSIISPNNGESNVSLGTPIQIAFSESVTGVNTTNVELHIESTTGVLVATTISQLQSNNYLITPESTLNYSTTYYLIIKDGITDAKYNLALIPQVFNFSMESQPIALATWITGENTINNSGVYASIGNSGTPGGREEASSWTDSNNNFWLFGGQGYDQSGNLGQLNDLWKYNKVSNQWIWITGSQFMESAGVYGVKGTASNANVPGARAGAMSWADNNGNLWLFGGYGYDINSNRGYLNDLWKYNTNSGKWTWISGSAESNQAGVYGTKGSYSSANVPGARDSALTWIDASGNLWLFGGCVTIDQFNCSLINDLWEYNIAANQWRWVSGYDTPNQSGNYGSLKVPSVNNLPTPREAGAAWVGSDGNLWLFGGCCSSNYNDLWRYNPLTGAWTWMSGSDQPGQGGNYGTLGIPSLNNLPEAREDMISWVDNYGNFWLFGGTGTVNDRLGDYWKYNPYTGLWVWMGGSNQGNQAGVYGTQSVASASNQIGGREALVHWADSITGNVWIFGGYGYANQQFSRGELNDMWMVSY